MEQTPSLPGRTPELPSVSLSPDREGGVARPGPEVISGGSLEQQPRRSEVAPRAEQVAPPISVAPSVPAVPAADDATDDQAVVSLPTVANDDDLIEKEWVVKAKKVLAETKDDPYRREQEVGLLQADYLLKRYGRELGSSQG